MPDSPFMGFSGPLYDQVHKHLRARILAGEWEHRQPLPPEVMLSQELGVSVGTVRKAMEKLMQEKIVVRERGRGTFVRQEASQQPSSMLVMRDQGCRAVEPQKSSLHHTMQRATGHVARLFAPRLGPNASLPLVKFERDWRADHLLVCHETIAVYQPALSDSAGAASLSGDTLFAKYHDQYRAQVHSVRWEIGSQPLFASCDIVDVLESPLSVITCHVFGANSEQFETCEYVVSTASHSFAIAQ